jgi:hypothetical protein
MYSRSLRLDDAFDYVRARRRVISPNANFMMQLVQFEAELRSLGFADSSSMPLKPAISPCRLFSHSKSAFDLAVPRTARSACSSPSVGVGVMEAVVEALDGPRSPIEERDEVVAAAAVVGNATSVSTSSSAVTSVAVTAPSVLQSAAFQSIPLVS